MNIELNMAWRNLWRHRKRTWLTVGAMVFSNVLLIFMLSLQLGSYQMMIEGSLKLFTGHVQLQHPDYLQQPKLRNAITDSERLSQRLRQALPELNISQRAETFALVSSEQRSLGVKIIGIEPQYDGAVSSLKQSLHSGRYFSAADRAEIILGSVLADNLNVAIGDEITLLGNADDGSFAAGVATVIGIFQTNVNDIDRNLAQLPLEYFRETFFNQQSLSNAIVVTGANASQAERIQQQLQQRVVPHADVVALNWDQLQPGVKQSIQADLASNAVIYFVLVILVCFSVMNTQLMSVLERTREFGTVIALGFKPLRLSKLVMLESILMALLGLVISVTIGALVTYYFVINGLQFSGMEEMAQKFHMDDTIYPTLNIISILTGPILVCLGTVVATLYPALKILKLEPLQAMKAIS